MTNLRKLNPRRSFEFYLNAEEDDVAVVDKNGSKRSDIVVDVGENVGDLNGRYCEL